MHITVVGAGGVGAQTLLLLHQMRPIKVNVIDRDIVDKTTLSRQTLYTQTDIGKLKTKAVTEKLGFAAKNEHVNADNADGLLGGATVVLDCTDNWQTRCVINQWALESNVPWVFTSAIKNETMATTLTKKTPCFVCWSPTPKIPRSCRTEGITREATHRAAQTQVMELQRIMEGKPALESTLQYTDTTTKTCATKTIKKNSACPACVKKTFSVPKTKAAVLCGDGEYLIETGYRFTKDALSSLSPKRFGDVLKIPWKKGELVVFKSGRVLTQGLSEKQAEAAADALKQKQKA